MVFDVFYSPHDIIFADQMGDQQSRVLLLFLLSIISVQMTCNVKIYI